MIFIETYVMKKLISIFYRIWLSLTLKRCLT